MTPQDAYATVQQTLLSIVMEAMTFEEIDADLRATGHHDAADTLDRLIQDTGLALKRAMDAPAPGDEDAGPKTAAINTLYTPVTAARLFTTLDNILPLITQGSLQTAVNTLHAELRGQEKDYTAAQRIIEADESPAPARGHADTSPKPFP